MCCFPQHIPQHSTKVSGPEKVFLREVSTIQIPSLPAGSISMPVFCEEDGGLLFRLVLLAPGVMDPVDDPVYVSSDGKTVIQFSRSKINDITDPTLVSAFVRGGDVYILTIGHVPLGYENKWRTAKGEVIGKPAVDISAFVAHFKRDGNYAGAVPLDLQLDKFRPLQLGVFDGGQFLIAGADPHTYEPHLAIVGSDGQLLRSIELKGDVHEAPESEASGGKTDPTAFPRRVPRGSHERSLTEIVGTSEITPDGPNLLLFRKTNGPIFSVSPSGEVRLHKLKVDGNHELFTVIANRNLWVAELLHDIPQGEAFSTYAFDPESGIPLREYLFPKDFGWGLACTDGDQFTFINADYEKRTLSLVKLATKAE